MRVDFAGLLRQPIVHAGGWGTHIILLQTEYDLTWNDSLIWVLEMQVCIQGKARRIFKDVRGHWTILDHVGHGTYTSVQ